MKDPSDMFSPSPNTNADHNYTLSKPPDSINTHLFDDLELPMSPLEARDKDFDLNRYQLIPDPLFDPPSSPPLPLSEPGLLVRASTPNNACENGDYLV